MSAVRCILLCLSCTRLPAPSAPPVRTAHVRTTQGTEPESSKLSQVLVSVTKKVVQLASSPGSQRVTWVGGWGTAWLRQADPQTGARVKAGKGERGGGMGGPEQSPGSAAHTVAVVDVSWQQQPHRGGAGPRLQIRSLPARGEKHSHVLCHYVIGLRICEQVEVPVSSSVLSAPGA